MSQQLALLSGASGLDAASHWVGISGNYFVTPSGALPVRG